jgi:recombination protein RecR
MGFGEIRGPFVKGIRGFSSFLKKGMKIPKAVQNLMEALERLPGIGPKTAQRLTFYLLQVPTEEAAALAAAVANLRQGTVVCSVCKNVAEKDPCEICQDPARDRTVLCVVENALDVLAIERSGLFKGLYHVLGGALNPLENIGPEELFIGELMVRLGADEKGLGSRGQGSGEEVIEERAVPLATSPYALAPIREVILATNPTMEGEATAMYVRRLIREAENQKIREIKVTRIGHGLPMGADLEYADERTLGKALEGRREY